MDGDLGAGLPGFIKTIQSGEQHVREDGCTLPQSSFHDSQTLIPTPPPPLDLPARAHLEDGEKMNLPLGPCSTCSTCSSCSSSGPYSWAGVHEPLYEAPTEVGRLQVQEALTSVQ